MGLLEGAGIALIFFLLGRFLPARRKGPKPVEAVCGCEHHHSMHDGETGHCHAQVDKPTRYDSYGTEVAYEKVQCSCRRYSGPEPIPLLYANEIAGEPGQ